MSKLHFKRNVTMFWVFHISFVRIYLFKDNFLVRPNTGNVESLSKLECIPNFPKRYRLQYWYKVKKNEIKQKKTPSNSDHRVKVWHSLQRELWFVTYSLVCFSRRRSRIVKNNLQIFFFCVLLLQQGPKPSRHAKFMTGKQTWQPNIWPKNLRNPQHR